MIMPRSNDQLLLPARPLFIGLTSVAAFALNLLPLELQPSLHDQPVLVVRFWDVHQLRLVLIWWAFILR